MSSLYPILAAVAYHLPFFGHLCSNWIHKPHFHPYRSRSRLYLLSKWFARWLSGCGEIARLCASIHPSHTKKPDEWMPKDTISLLDSSFSSSVQLKDARSNFLKSISNQNSVASAVDSIAKSKLFPTQKPLYQSVVLPRLRYALERIRSSRLALHSLRSNANQQYSSENQQHEASLEELWSLLKPSVRRQRGRYTSEWGEIGFQGQDPKTDFRGMGVLALKNLIHFSKEHNETARQILLSSSFVKDDKAWYPFSVAGINLTSDLLQLFERGELAAYFYDIEIDEQRALFLFGDLFSKTFILFHSHWIESNPKSVMEFNAIKQDFIKNKLVPIARSGTLNQMPSKHQQ